MSGNVSCNIQRDTKTHMLHVCNCGASEVDGHFGQAERNTEVLGGIVGGTTMNEIWSINQTLPVFTL